ncbi:MAG: nitroreductase family protein [Clostridia bacterium]|nr:nitroreductase family protein [Clostridia bacterium]
MNEIIKSLFHRKSVRQFTESDIDEKTRELLLSAASEAPTAGNQQLYTIIDVRNQKIKDKLAVSCDNQPFIRTAPMVLIFCADCKKWDDAYRSIGLKPKSAGEGDLFIAIEDAVIAAQNVVVAAESVGLGSCYIGDIIENREYHKELFSLPDRVVPICMLVIGYPTEGQKKRNKPTRCEQKFIVHTDSYRRMNGDELREMLSYKAGDKSYEEWLTAFCKRKYDSDFCKEMTRSAKGYIKEFE